MYQGRDKSDKTENQSKPHDVRSDGIVFIDCVFFLTDARRRDADKDIVNTSCAVNLVERDS